MRFKILKENIYDKNSNNNINKKKYKKHSMSPFTKLDAGDVEHNINMFNKMNGSNEVNTTAAESASMSEGLNESLNTETIKKLIDKYMDVLIWLEDK